MDPLPSPLTDKPSETSPPRPAVEEPGSDGSDGALSLPPLGVDPYIRATTPAVILEAQDAFWQDLPELLKEREGQWVAYYGRKRIGFGKTKTALWQECCRQGYRDFLIRCVYPFPDVDYISAL